MGRLLRVVAWLIAGLCLLYLAQGLVGSIRVSAARERAATDLADALPAAERQAAAQHRRVRAALGGLGSADHSWRELVCELDTNDVGWVIDDWVQDCHIRSVDLVPVVQAAEGECEHLFSPEAVEASGSAVADVRRGRAALLAAKHPWRRGCPDGLTGPPLIGASRLLHGRRPDSLAASPAWVVMETQTPVSRTVLGCDPWVLLFCSEPVDAAEVTS